MKDQIISFCSQESSYRLILLHGWGADANDLIPFGQGLIKEVGFSFDLISFNAPHPHPDGAGRQWYSLFPPDWSQVPQAIEDLRNRLKSTVTNAIPFQKTFLLGFSQGGAMALSAGLGLPLAGLVSCSGYPHPGWEPEASQPKILLTHGKNDEIVPLRAIKEISYILDKKKINYQTKLFNGGHEISQEIMTTISFFIRKNI